MANYPTALFQGSNFLKPPNTFLRSPQISLNFLLSLSETYTKTTKLRSWLYRKFILRSSQYQHSCKFITSIVTRCGCHSLVTSWVCPKIISGTILTADLPYCIQVPSEQASWRQYARLHYEVAVNWLQGSKERWCKHSQECKIDLRNFKKWVPNVHPIEKDAMYWQE